MSPNFKMYEDPMLTDAIITVKVAKKLLHTTQILPNEELVNFLSDV